MKLAVYTIMKNEGKFLDNWIKNMLEADYVVVLDTGSTDGSYERLLEYQEQYPDKIIVGQKVYEDFRFDTARNDNLDMVPKDTDIYISIDLDELMTPEGWVDKIKAVWKPGETQRGSYLYTWSFTDSGKPLRQFWYNKLHNKDWRWSGVVHELLRSTMNDSEHYDRSVSVTVNGIMLEHHPDKTKSRGSYLGLLRKRKEEEPNNPYTGLFLCHELYYRGLYQESIDELKYTYERFYDEITSTERASCFLFMGDDYRALGNTNEAILCYQKAIFEDNTYREGYLNLAKALMDRKDFSIAKGYIEQGLKNSYRHFSWLERDTSWSYEPYDLLCLANYYSGHYKEAFDNAVWARDLDPDNERLEENVRLCEKAIH